MLILVAALRRYASTMQTVTPPTTIRLPPEQCNSHRRTSTQGGTSSSSSCPRLGFALPGENILVSFVPWGPVKDCGVDP